MSALTFDVRSSDSISQLKAIDVHAHYGICDRPDRPLTTSLMSADAATVEQRAAACNIEYTVVSPLKGLMPRGKANAVTGNDEAVQIVRKHRGLLQWVIVNPREPRTYAQADEMLKSDRCMGIKIHPEEHLYHISEFGEQLFAFAAERRAVVLTHSGEANSMPADFILFADAHPEMKLILAHIGCGYDRDMGHQVRAIQTSRAGNIYADTSSASSIVANLIEWAVREIGADRVLFGTDTPLYSTALQRTRIDCADLSEADKRSILRDNAIGLLRIPAEVPR
jgi:predicted TIM-barrel fold metal-dependent hydrolase